MASALLAVCDDYFRGQAILSAPIEKEFGRIVAHQEECLIKLKDLQRENSELRHENDKKNIKLKNIRSTLDDEIRRRKETEDTVRQYDNQFAMIRKLLSSRDRMSLLNEEERSLFNFQQQQGSESVSSSGMWDSEVDVCEDDEDASILRNGRKWIRRRTRSVENHLDEPSAKRKSKDGTTTVAVTTKTTVHISPQARPPPVTLTRPACSQRKGNVQAQLTRSFSEDNILDTTKDFEAQEMEILAEQEVEKPISAPNTPSAPPAPEGLYPILEDMCEPSPPPVPSAPTCPSSPGKVSTCPVTLNTRPHAFVIKKVIKPDVCQVCKKTIMFGKSAHRCKFCQGVCHGKCKQDLPVPCVPVAPTPKRNKHDGYLASFCPTSSPHVPALIIHCAREVEKRGLSEVGIYRVSGSDSKIKELKEKLLKGKGQPNLSKVDDIHVICCVLKDFLRELKEPLVTFDLHRAFTLAADMENDEEALAQLLQVIARLPEANKDTLAFLILHLLTVAGNSQQNKMTAESLAKVFGPTVVGHSCAKPDPATIWHDTHRQPKVILKLMGIAREYWEEFVNPNEQYGLIRSPDAISLRSPTINSPATPECIPIPESPFLGPYHSPQTTQRPASKTNYLPPKSRRNGPFFASLD